MTDEKADGWKEAAIAWSVCQSIHAKYAKGKDALFTKRQEDFIKHWEDARAKWRELDSQSADCPNKAGDE